MTRSLQRRPLLEELESRGVRLTSQRRLLIEEIQKADQHLDAALLFERARRRDARVDRATVYRTLGLLKRLGLIDELDLMHLNGEKHYYEARTSRDHLHLACFRCGTIQEFTSPFYDQLKQEIQQRCGFAIDVIRLEVGGRCRTCSGGAHAQQT
jgi:Fur family ferric uptake transcriptional regulator